MKINCQLIETKENNQLWKVQHEIKSHRAAFQLALWLLDVKNYSAIIETPVISSG